jgi:hypothetical protein
MDKQGLIMLGTIMMWGCRILCIQDIVLFSVFGVKYYNEYGLPNGIVTLGAFIMSLFFLVMSQKYKKKITLLKQNL